MRNKQVRRKISIFNNNNKNQNIDILFNIFLKIIKNFLYIL